MADLLSDVGLFDAGTDYAVLPGKNLRNENADTCQAIAFLCLHIFILLCANIIPKATNNQPFVENTEMEENTSQPNNDLADSNKDLYAEGRLREVVLSVHERNPVARKKCIEHYGSRCYICQFDFVDRYGSLFDGLIHVHHRNPVHLKDEEYIIDPIRDLIPVCPNCHMALHSKVDGVYTPEEIIEFIHR